MSFKILNYDSFSTYQKYVLGSIRLVKKDYLDITADLHRLEQVCPDKYSMLRKLSHAVLRWSDYVRGANPKKDYPFVQCTFTLNLVRLLHAVSDVASLINQLYYAGIEDVPASTSESSESSGSSSSVLFPVLREFLYVMGHLKISSDIARDLRGFEGYSLGSYAYLRTTKEEVRVSFNENGDLATYCQEVYNRWDAVAEGVGAPGMQKFVPDVWAPIAAPVAPAVAAPVVVPVAPKAAETPAPKVPAKNSDDMLSEAALVALVVRHSKQPLSSRARLKMINLLSTGPTT